jgi:glycosyltransferase involved in cell wall biosynthesis
VVVPENLLRAQAISTPSHFLAREIQRLAPGAPEASIAPNGVDTELFRPRERTACRQELDIDPDVPLVVYAGRITEAKGVFDLADALPMIQKLVPTARCAFLGPVDSSSRALAVPRRGDAPSSSAFLVPATDQREVALWMGAADIVVVPSHYEGFGLAALEAMASARPVVASAVGGLCEFVDDTVGSLVPSSEPAKLADAVAALLLAPDRAAALGAAGYQRASAFTWSATANLLAAAYDQLISEARR